MEILLVSKEFYENKEETTPTFLAIAAVILGLLAVVAPFRATFRLDATWWWGRRARRRK